MHFVPSEVAVQHSLLDCFQHCLTSFCSSEEIKDGDEESIVVSVLQSYLMLLGSPANQVQLNWFVCVLVVLTFTVLLNNILISLLNSSFWCCIKVFR